jgi:hypothetical protein
LIIYPPASQNDLGMIAGEFRATGQVIRIDADAVSADQTWGEMEEIPLRRRCSENIGAVDAEQVENQRQFVDQRYVEVALSVLNDLRRFGHLDRRRPVNPRSDNGTIDFSHDFECPRILS